MPVQQTKECWNCGATNPKEYECCKKCGEYKDDEDLINSLDELQEQFWNEQLALEEQQTKDWNMHPKSIFD